MIIIEGNNLIFKEFEAFVNFVTKYCEYKKNI